MRIGFFAVLLLSACASTPLQDMYTAPIGDFWCGRYPLGVNAVESIGPHGGTIRLRDGIREIRIDLEQFEPPLPGSALETKRELLYSGYLANNIMPLIQSAIPSAELLEAKSADIKNGRSQEILPVYKSVILMPAASPDGSKGLGVRGQVQYTNGKFMYTASSLATVQPEWSKEQKIKEGYEQLMIGLSWCHFPR